METLQLYFYSEIREGDAASTIAQLSASPNASVIVRINSPGGVVTEGLAIYNALRSRKPVIHIDGVAASIASLIAMAGHRIIAAENALIMVHDPWAAAEGNAGELRRAADLLDKHRDAMASAYLRTGLSRERLVALLNAETWLDAQEAKTLGFVDEIAEPLRFAAHAPDAFAGFRNTPRSLLMPAENTQHPVPSQGSGNAPTPPSALTPEAAIQAERSRVERINGMVVGFADLHSCSALIRAEINRAVSAGTSPEEFGLKLLGIVGNGATPLGHYGPNSTFEHGSPASETDFITAASDSLVMRAGLRVDKPHAGVRDLRGMGVHAMASACLSRAGRAHQRAGDALATIRAAMTTSDFPALLENSVAKAMRLGHELEPKTYELWTRLVKVPDFRDQSRVILGSAPALERVAEGAEYENGALDEDKSLPYAVEKWGRIISLSWEAMVNDDLGAFFRVAQGLGQAAARAEGDSVYGGFVLNSGAGPAMQDSVNLFHATHGNLTASQSAVNAAALAAGRVLLRRQTALGGGQLNLTPKYLLVAPEHEAAAEVVLAAAARGLSQGSANELTPAWLAALELVVEPRLPTSAIYLLTSPELIDTFERAHLEGEAVPALFERDGFRSDEHEWKARHVFGGRWLDWRGAVRIPITP